MGRYIAVGGLCIDIVQSYIGRGPLPLVVDMTCDCELRK